MARITPIGAGLKPVWNNRAIFFLSFSHFEEVFCLSGSSVISDKIGDYIKMISRQG